MVLKLLMCIVCPASTYVVITKSVRKTAGGIGIISSGTIVKCPGKSLNLTAVAVPLMNRCVCSEHSSGSDFW